MTYLEYQKKFPLTKQNYSQMDVEKIRKHAFVSGIPLKKETRSEKQNRYYWGVVLKIIGDDTGYTPDEIHQLMQKEFLKYTHKGEVFFRSTTSLNTKEMEQYLEQVRRFASTELGIFVPLPNETEFYYDAAS